MIYNHFLNQQSSTSLVYNVVQFCSSVVDTIFHQILNGGVKDKSRPEQKAPINPPNLTESEKYNV